MGKRCYKLFGLSFRSDGEEIVFSIALGLGCLSYLIFVLGLSRLLYWEVFYPLALILFIILLPDVKDFIKKFLPRIKGLAEELKVHKLTILGFILFSYLGITFLGSLAPVTDWDAGVFHLAFPKLCAQQHRLITTSCHVYYNNFIQMLYLPGTLINDECAAHLFQWLMSVLTVGALYLFMRKYFSVKTGIWAGLIFLTNPVIPLYSMSASVDMALIFYIFLTIYLVFEWHFSGDAKWLWLSGIFSGFSLGIKHSALIFIVLIAAGLFLMQWLVKREHFLHSIKKVAVFIGVAFLPVLPWYLWAYFYTGNPTFPMLNAFWGGAPLPMVKGPAFNPWVERTILNYFLFPWYITMIKLKYMNALTTASPLLLAFIPCLFFFWRNLNQIVKYFIFYSWGIITVFFFISHQPRYIAPLLPLLSILAAYALEKLIAQGKFIKIIIIPVLGLVLGSNFIILGAMVHYRLPVALGLESRDAFLSGRIDIYPAYQYINTHPDRFQTILIFDERGYYCNLPYIIGLPGAQSTLVNLQHRGYTNSYWIDYWSFKNNDEMLKRFKEFNISHILINFNHIKIDDKSELNRPFLELFNELQKKQYLELIFSKNNVFLYNIRHR